MCAAVKISPQIVIENDNNCGGVQYFFKNTTVLFWEKIETDCETLYALMQNHNKNISPNMPTATSANSNGHPLEIQA